MKKTRKNPDGTEDVLEGDPEELRKYEELAPDAPPQPVNEAPKKPGVLHGAEIDSIPVTDAERSAAEEWIRMIRKIDGGFTLEKFIKFVPPLQPPVTFPCRFCGQAWCSGLCIQLYDKCGPTLIDAESDYDWAIQLGVIYPKH